MDNTPKTMKELASLGIEYTRQIDQMLSEIWCHFKSLTPKYAAPFEKAFGSSTKLVVLAIASRLGDQASLLEQLTEKNLSKDEIENILQSGFQLVAQVKTSTQESERVEATEYLFAPQETLSQAVRRLRTNYEFELVDIFKRLEKDDPELASAILDLHADIREAAEFVATPAPGLDGKSPIQVVEEGGRQSILGMIESIKTE